MRQRNPTALALLLLAVTQMISGGLISLGCVCGFGSRLVGLGLSFGMAAVVGMFGGLSVWARTRPRSAAVTAAFLEGLVILLMLIPSVTPPLIAWYSQIVVYLLLCAATILAFRE